MGEGSIFRRCALAGGGSRDDTIDKTSILTRQTTTISRPMQLNPIISSSKSKIN